jgi:hypothetical protein
MPNGLLGLWYTHDLSVLVAYRLYNTTSRVETKVTTARGRHDTHMAMMVSELFATHAARHKECD